MRKSLLCLEYHLNMFSGACIGPQDTLEVICTSTNVGRVLFLLKSYSNYYFMTQFPTVSSLIHPFIRLLIHSFRSSSKDCSHHISHIHTLCSISLVFYYSLLPDSMHQNPQSNALCSLQFYVLRWKAKLRKL